MGVNKGAGNKEYLATEVRGDHWGSHAHRKPPLRKENESNGAGEERQIPDY